MESGAWSKVQGGGSEEELRIGSLLVKGVSCVVFICLSEKKELYLHVILDCGKYKL